MKTIHHQIIEYLKKHPEGIDDDMLAEALQLKYRQQANSRCRQLEKEGLIIRRKSHGKINNFWRTDARTKEAKFINKPLSSIDNSQPWFWEGNVQETVVQYLDKHGYTIISAVNTASKERGKDIEAEINGRFLWITVKGFPKGTKKTHPSTQAGHWFKGATFDLLQYRGESHEADLGMALPDFPRYHNLAKKISWIQPVLKFTYYWVSEDGSVWLE